MTTLQEKYDIIRLIRRELLNTDPIQIDGFGVDQTDAILRTSFTSSVELEKYSKEFSRIFFAHNGLVVYD